MARETRAFCWAVTVLVVACADSRDAAESVQATRPSLARCRDGWNRILEFQPMVGSAPPVLRWHDGNLYYPEHQDFSYRIVSLPDTGGTPSEVTPHAGPGLWIEGDSLLYPQFDQLYSAPLTGGESTLVSSGDRFGTEESKLENVTLLNQELDDAALYWILHRYTDPTWTVWRAPREGGPSEELGTLPDSLGHPEALVALSDRLMIAGSDGDAYLLPKDGGDVQRLPSIASERDEAMWSRFIGAAPSGVAWAVAGKIENTTRIPYDIVLSAPDGDVEDLWRDMSAEFDPDHVWPDGKGGWVIAGLETFTDEEKHTSLWSLDAKNRAKRLACDSRPGRSSGFTVTAALSDDAAYAVVEYYATSHKVADEDPEAMGWTLIKVEQ
jgi:hypothetical protein